MAFSALDSRSLMARNTSEWQHHENPAAGSVTSAMVSPPWMERCWTLCATPSRVNDEKAPFSRGTVEIKWLQKPFCHINICTSQRRSLLPEIKTALRRHMGGKLLSFICPISAEMCSRWWSFHILCGQKFLGGKGPVRGVRSATPSELWTQRGPRLRLHLPSWFPLPLQKLHLLKLL